MRFSVLFVVAVTALQSVAAVDSTLRHPRDVVPRATTSSEKSSKSSSNDSKPSTTSKRTSTDPTTSPTKNPSKTPTQSPKPTKTSSPTDSPPSETPSSIETPPPTETPSPTETPQPSTEPTNTPPPTASPSPEPKAGLSEGAKIGLGIGIPLALAAIGGVVAAYVVGKRRGRRRRVDDPTAGASQRIRDPSDELNLVRTPTGIIELPAAVAGGYGGSHQRNVSLSTWWKPVGKNPEMQKWGYDDDEQRQPLSPQEMPA